MPDFSVPDAFHKLEAKLLADLGMSDPTPHPDAKGDTGELSWVTMLRDFLPSRYSVDKAFAVSVDQAVSKQLDLVIYDPRSRLVNCDLENNCRIATHG